jgi:orotidine-5'-phosphate decarboxylase
MFFVKRIEQAAMAQGSNIVLAFDFPFEKPEHHAKLFMKAEEVLESVHAYICAVKFNHHLILPLGTFDGVQKLVKKTHDFGLQAIMDCKANDVGSTNEVIAKYYFEAGFDALIANPFVGWEEGLEPIFRVAEKLEGGVILLVYMSHKAAPEGYGQTVIDPVTGNKMLQYIAFAQKAVKYKASGAVVGATYPEKIREVHNILGDNIPIYSPGIGVQGGLVQQALKAGSHYLIVGRLITQAIDPSEAAKKIKESARITA